MKSYSFVFSGILNFTHIVERFQYVHINILYFSHNFKLIINVTISKSNSSITNDEEYLSVFLWMDASTDAPVDVSIIHCSFNLLSEYLPYELHFTSPWPWNGPLSYGYPTFLKWDVFVYSKNGYAQRDFFALFEIKIQVDDAKPSLLQKGPLPEYERVIHPSAYPR